MGWGFRTLYPNKFYRGTTVCILIFYITLFVLLFRYYSSCITLSELSELSNVLCAYFICSKQYVVVVLAVVVQAVPAVQVRAVSPVPVPAARLRV